ncbi:MAG: hypothetical protein ACK5LJ_15300 [Paracoccus sp. (in: a-proteobacteria)]
MSLVQISPLAITLVIMLAGFGLGWYRAGRIGGDRKDRWQWGIAHGLLFLLIWVFASLIIQRML